MDQLFVSLSVETNRTAPLKDFIDEKASEGWHVHTMSTNVIGQAQGLFFFYFIFRRKVADEAVPPVEGAVRLGSGAIKPEKRDAQTGTIIRDDGPFPGLPSS